MSNSIFNNSCKYQYGAESYYQHMFLIWVNDFITVKRFAEYYDLPAHKAIVIINKGRTLQQDKFGHH